MSFINYQLIAKIPRRYKSAVGYYPDMLVYQHDLAQYETQWRQLARSQYIYTNGYDLRPTGLLRYSFETFKGWLGFNNHCAQEKVHLSLYKFAYYGYLKGYQQTQLAQLSHYQLPADILKLVSSPYSKNDSLSLQKKLISYYTEHADSFFTSEQLINITTSHSFGKTFGYLKLWSEIPKLDPQNKTLINQTIEELETDKTPSLAYSFLFKSEYAKQAALYYIQKATTEKASPFFYNLPVFNTARPRAQSYLERAYWFDPTVRENNKELYIDYFLEKEKYKEAYTWIEKLTDMNKALAYLTTRFSAQQLFEFVQKDSPQALLLSRHYLAKNNAIETIVLALHFNSNLENDDPANLFKLLVAEKKYTEAYALFTKYERTISFNAKDCNLLANYFDNSGENFYDKGVSYRKSSDWVNAQINYIQSLSEKEKAYQLEPNKEREESKFIHKRLYAQLVIAADMSKFEEAKDCEIEHILKAIKILDSCAPQSPEEQQLHKRSLVNGLMRQVDYLTHRFSVPLLYAKDYKLQETHKQQYKKDIIHALNALTRVVNLLGGTNDKTLKLILGKAYFLLGDINLFFDLKTYTADYFRKAMQTVPDNPFYLLRASEVFAIERDALLRKAVPLLKKHGFEVINYANWDQERWEQDNYKTSNINDIHFLTSDAKNAVRSFGI